jgi:hypothetical protein
VSRDCASRGGRAGPTVTVSRRPCGPTQAADAVQDARALPPGETDHPGPRQAVDRRPPGRPRSATHWQACAAHHRRTDSGPPAIRPSPPASPEPDLQSHRRAGAQGGPVLERPRRRARPEWVARDGRRSLGSGWRAESHARVAQADSGGRVVGSEDLTTLAAGRTAARARWRVRPRARDSGPKGGHCLGSREAPGRGPPTPKGARSPREGGGCYAPPG